MSQFQEQFTREQNWTIQSRVQQFVAFRDTVNAMMETGTVDQGTIAEGTVHNMIETGRDLGFAWSDEQIDQMFEVAQAADEKNVRVKKIRLS